MILDSPSRGNVRFEVRRRCETNSVAGCYGFEQSLRENVPLAPMTTLGIGGPARYFADITDTEALLAGVDWAALSRSSAVRARRRKQHRSRGLGLSGTGASRVYSRDRDETRWAITSS